MRALLLSALILMSAAARADDWSTSKRDYPLARIDRPLILPPLMLSPELGVSIDNTNPSDSAFSSAAGAVLDFGLEVGIVPRLQAGAWFAFPLAPNGDFGAFLVNAQYGILHELSVRLDLGAGREKTVVPGLFAFNDTRAGFLFGAGMPVKYAFHRMVAFTSGSSAARGFGVPSIVAASAVGQSFSTFLTPWFFPDDLVSMFVYDNGNGTTATGALSLPIGILVQPHPIFSAGVRTGYRLLFSHSTNQGVNDTKSHFVPLAFDVAASILGKVDVGFTVMLVGFVGGDRFATTSKSGYADLQQYEIWFKGFF